MKLLLYSSQVSVRLKYITGFIGRELFSEEINITTDKNAFIQHEGPRINYSREPLCADEWRIPDVILLFEEGIVPQPVNCFQTPDYTAFFQTAGGDLPFDIFAASFYLLSRYEEYLPHQSDEYGRYAFYNSLAAKENFLHLPLVNIWLEDLRKVLYRKFPSVVFSGKKFRFIPTYDIDIAFSYRNKGLKRNLGGFVKSTLRADWRGMFNRMAVLLHRKKDPFDCYQFLHSMHKAHDLQAYYFFLVAQKQEGYDKNISPSADALQRLIRFHASCYTIGIHPSWRSGDQPRLLKWEKQWLQKITGKDIIHNRQHYIRFRLPETYRTLINAGILKEYSMGYGSINGFRASVASSFNWYDLQNEETTKLVIYPFCFMDANACYEQKLNTQEAFDELVEYYNIIKKVNGLMITIWHNHLLGTEPAFAGWKQMYERFIEEIIASSDEKRISAGIFGEKIS